MRVSVVICTRNRADELANCLASLEYQTAVEFEVLVVQGPCQDSTDGLIDRYAGRIRHLRCEHANLSEARNIGIAAAAAEVVAFIDDDSVAHPKWLEQIISAYTAEDIGGVGGLVFDHTGRTLQYRYSACRRSGDTIFDVAPPFDRLNRPGADPFLYLQGTNCSFRKRCLVEVGGFNEQFAYYHDETDICLRIIDKGYKLVPLDRAAVYHKFAKSDIRTPARITLDPFFSMRSQYIFALRNGRAFYSESDLQRAINRYMAQVIGIGVEGRAQRQLSEEQLTHFFARVHEGISSGLEAAGREPILRAFDDCGDAQFLRFPIKRDPSSRMTICFLSREYPPTGYGGIGRFTYDLAVGLAGDGHHVHVITDSAGADATDFENGVWIHRLTYAPRLSPPRVPLADHYNLAARNYREIDRIFKDTRIDIVSAPLWNCEGAAAAFDARFPTVLSLMTSFKVVKELHPSTHNTVQATQLLQLEQACYRSHKYLHAISQDVLDRAEADFGKATTSKVVHLGVQDNTCGRRACLNRRLVRVLFVGRLERRKGIDLLLQAAATLIDEHLEIEFYLVGSDSIHNELANQNYQTWSELTFSGRPDILSRVVFVGAVSEEALHQHYADASIFCLPSRYESLGLVLMEAMSFGLPVVAANTGGMKEVVAHETDGLLFEPENANALADAIRLLATIPAMRERMGRAARASFECRFTTAVTVPRALEYYQSIARSFVATRARRAGNSVVLSRFAELIRHCSEVDEKLARQAAEELLAASAANVVAPAKKRSNLARFGRFLSEIPRSFGRNKRRIKRILSIVERQDANVDVAIKSLSAAQSGTDRRIEALHRENRVLHEEVGESQQMLADLTKAHEDLVRRVSDRLEVAMSEAVASLARSLAEIRKAQDDLADRILEASTAQMQSLVELSNKRPEREPETIAALLQRVSHIQERLEFVRTEILFEFGAHDRRRSRGARASDPKPPAIDGDIRLNLGCGHFALPGYVNIDNRDLPGVGLVCDVGELPFPEASVTAIYSSHLLEHFPVEVLRRKLLVHWVYMIKPGGVFRAVVPDAECMIDAYVRREMSFDDLRTVTFGLQEYAGDFHFNMFSRNELQSILSEAGLINVAYAFTGRRNGLCFDMEIQGYSPR